MSPDHAAELMSLLTARVASWEPAIGAFNAIRVSDIAQALGMVKNTSARLLMRVKYSDGQDSLPELESRFLDALERGMLGHIVELAAPQRWKIPRPGFLRDLGRLALAEHIAPKLCPRCGGRQTIMRRRLVQTCPRCEGKGTINITDQERARLMGVSRDAWRHSWRERYRAIAGILDHYDDLGKRAVAYRLR